MIRQVAAVALVTCLTPVGLSAQTPAPPVVPAAELRINTQAAPIYRSPSTGSPVVGTARRGAILPVTRELGSWVRVSWPDAEEGAGYVHVSSGSLMRSGPASATRDLTPTQSGQASMPMMSSTEAGDPSASVQQPVNMRTGTVYVPQPTHVVGLGGKLSGSTLGYGISGRAWSHGRFGVQFDLSRSRITTVGTPEQVTMVQFAPSLLYSLPDRVSDYVWMRPYVGAGASMNRHTLRLGVADTGLSVSDNAFGFRTFGGGEFTFASMPKFTVSADLGYDWTTSPYIGYDFGGFGFALSGHWYVK
jgi:SH3 domain-containing protein